MKLYKLLILLGFIFSFANHGFAQKVAEKLIPELPASIADNPYDMKYDRKTGSFIYSEYDTSSSTANIVCPKGRSKKFSGTNNYMALFDQDGNVYSAAYDVVKDTVSVFYLLKNADVVASFDNIDENWTERNGTLYFDAKENGKAVFITYEFSTGKITRSGTYDLITLLYAPDGIIARHGEYFTYPGFTSTGKLYYLASRNGKLFMVIGGEEQKEYKDIDIFSCTTDLSGGLVYTANGSGDIYFDTTKVVLVQGSKEYNAFDYIYGPILFDKSNTPIYTAGNKDPNGSYPQAVYRGNDKISKDYGAGIDGLQITSGGKIAFIGSTYPDKTKTSGAVVIDGVEGKKHGSIYGLQFTGDGEPIFVRNENAKEYVIVGDEKQSETYDAIVYKEYAGGKLFYAGQNFQSSGKVKSDETWIFAGDKKYGPFDIELGEGEGMNTFIKIDSLGNYIINGIKITDLKNYLSERTVYTSKGKAGPFDDVTDFMLYKGRPIFTATNTNGGKNLVPKTKIFIDMKEASGEYQYVMDLKLDGKKGILNFVGVRDSKFYSCEIKL